MDSDPYSSILHLQFSPEPSFLLFSAGPLGPTNSFDTLLLHKWDGLLSIPIRCDILHLRLGLNANPPTGDLIISLQKFLKINNYYLKSLFDLIIILIILRHLQSDVLIGPFVLKDNVAG